MKPGLVIGEERRILVNSTASMRAGFDMGDHFIEVHPLYGTAAMVSHMEWTARQHLLPVLADHEEGVGAEVSLKHLRPVPLGKTVEFCSILREVRGNKLVSDVTVWVEGEQVGVGWVVQAVVDKAAFVASWQKV